MQNVSVDIYKRAFENAGHAIYITDSLGNIRFTNQALSEITGYSKSWMLGKNPRFLKSGKMSPEYYGRLWKTILGGSHWEEDVTNRRKDGQLYCAHQSVAPIKDGNGAIAGFIAIQNDISTQKALEIALQESESRYRSVISAMSEGLILMDSQGKIITANKAAEKILRRSADQVYGRTSNDPDWGAIREDGTPFPGAEHPAPVTLKTGKSFDGIIMGLKNDTDQPHWISINSRPLYTPGQEAPSSVLTTFTDITSQKQKQEDLKKLSETDFLTGIFNRRAFLPALEKELSRSRRHKFPLTLIMMDFDYFKKINDIYGHDAGDQVLKISAHHISGSLRAGDVLARWGGEEFLLMAPHTSLDQAGVLAERIRKLIEALKEGLPCGITLSLGVTTSNFSDQPNAEELIDRADRALYMAKQAGRNRFSIFSDTF